MILAEAYMSETDQATLSNYGINQIIDFRSYEEAKAHAAPPERCRTPNYAEDLKMRGSGEIFGTRQSGLPEFQVADIIEDFPILEEARRDPDVRPSRIARGSPGAGRPSRISLPPASGCSIRKHATRSPTRRDVPDSAHAEP